MRSRSLILFTLFVALVLAGLVGLGLWQLQRLEWKEALIANIEARVKAEPVGLAEAIAQAERGEDISYLRVSAQGVFDHDQERYLYALSGNAPGWHVITPMKTPQGPVVLVDRGFVPGTLKDPSTRPEGQVQGKVEVTGLVRPAEKQAPFTPDNAPGDNRWFWRDLASLKATMPALLRPHLAPFFIEAEARATPKGGWPQGGETRLTFKNDHLQYAITWFLLAGAVLVIYLVFLRTRFRQQGEPAQVAAEGRDR